MPSLNNGPFPGTSLGAALMLSGAMGPLLALVDRPAALQGFMASESKIEMIDADALAAAHVTRLIEGGQRLYVVDRGVAVIPVLGSLMQSFPYVGFSFATGYDTLAAQVEQAMDDRDVRAIAFRIASPGGMVSGLFDLTDQIEALREEHEKPILSILDDYAYSAAYAIAATADQISVPRMGGLGSIGAIAVHFEFSKMLEEEGIAVSVIRAGERKARGNMLEPLDSATRAEWQAGVDEAREAFASMVGRNRARVGGFETEAAGKAAALKSEAGVWDGMTLTAEAVAGGFADSVLRPEAAFEELAASVA